MIEEIIYTSAPKGLRAGSHGFCTVVSTAGMAANMAERLESMSGYRHAFPLNDPNNALNPINFSHVTTRMAGQKRHVVSRISNAGQDYSGRTNKLAHHIALENVQSLAGGPGRLIASSGFLQDSWNGKVETRPPRSVVDAAVPKKVTLSAWKTATGDGGWAGAVAENLLASKAPVNVIFSPGTDTLPLVVEVLDLVPIPKRWGVTFSTYFIRLLAGTECQLRFYLDGTSEATKISNDARAITIDLTKSLPPADGGTLVERARGGVIETAHQTQTTQAGHSTRPKEGRGRIVSDTELTNFLGEDGLPVGSPNTPFDSLDFGETNAAKTRFSKTFGAKKRQLPIAIIASVALAFVVAVGIGAFVLSRPADQIEQAGGQIQPVSPVKLVEIEDSNPEAPVEEVIVEPTVSAEPAQIPKNPFGTRKPFDAIRDIFGQQSGLPVWQLPNPDTEDRLPAADVFVASASDVNLQSDTAGVQVLEQTSGESRKWLVSIGGHNLGAIELRASPDNQPAVIEWRWDSTISAPTDIQSSLAGALRMFRKAHIKLSARQQRSPFPQPADQLTLSIAGDAWPRFAHLGSGIDNRGLTLEVPEPGTISNSGNLLKNSKSVFIDAEHPNDITLAVVGECNSLLDEYDAYLAKQSKATDAEVVWNLGLRLKNGDAKDGVTFGTYSLCKTDTPGLVSMNFEWLPNFSVEDAAPLQWVPIEISIAGQSHVLFPRGPDIARPTEIVDLGQGDACEIPSGRLTELPFRFPEQNVSVNFEVRIRAKNGPVSCLLKATRKQPTPKAILAYFQLKSPLSLSPKLGKEAADLGDAMLLASPSEAEANVIPSSIRLRTEAGFNRSSLYHLQSVYLINVFDPRYWTDKGVFERQAYRKAANEMLTHVATFSLPLDTALRNSENRLARFPKLKDPFQRIENHLTKSVSELDRLLTFSEADLRPTYPRITPKGLKKRSDPQVQSLLKQQFDAISKIRDRYSDEQWKQDEETVRQMQEELSQLIADVDISLELQRSNGKPLRLYFVSTSRKAGAK